VPPERRRSCNDSTINEALWAVEGTHIVKLDADDVLTPGSPARAARVLKGHPDMSFAYPSTKTLPAWRELQLRRRLSGRRAGAHPALVLGAVSWRRFEIARRRERFLGV
jgi:hypothetical protein